MVCTCFNSAPDSWGDPGQETLSCDSHTIYRPIAPADALPQVSNDRYPRSHYMLTESIPLLVFPAGPCEGSTYDFTQLLASCISLPPPF